VNSDDAVLRGKLRAEALAPRPVAAPTAS